MDMHENAYGEEANLTGLIDLLFYCLKKWRWIAAAMLIVAVLAGGYKYYSIKRSNQAALEQWNNLGTEEKPSVNDVDILQYYQSVIERRSQGLQSWEDYLGNSEVMKMDANHLQKGILSFVLKLEDTDYAEDVFSTLIAAFRAYVTDGRLARVIYSEDEDTAIADSQYLLSFSSDDRPTLDTAEPDAAASRFGEGVFQIQIVSEDETACEKQIEAAVQAVQSYSAKLQEQVGAHELTLLASGVSEGRDQAIQDYQTKVLGDYITEMQNLNMLRTEAKSFADNLDTENVASEVLTEPVLASPLRAGVKYAILGLVLGAILACIALVVLFLMSDRLRSTENFERKFGVNLLGRVIEPVRSRGLFGALDRGFQRLREGAYANLSYDEQVKIVAANIKAAASLAAGNTIRVMLAGTVASRDVADVCAAFAKKIDGVSFSDYHQLIFDVSALEELNGYDEILFIEKKDVSSTRMICQECKMAADRNVKVLGAIVI